ncbi:hypothetical protein CPB84DRAFT_1752371 [Gymnopilus junonius]|uniref:Uncharacterized protein n=1 Tax=Gymnopilus junonius TaxID=109634 RepID=A0A9P5TG13_GYMJU|nr:hypothetical protein CPB84DRAFT_1752371 [Gymnopilus junonius]
MGSIVKPARVALLPMVQNAKKTGLSAICVGYPMSSLMEQFAISHPVNPQAPNGSQASHHDFGSEAQSQYSNEVISRMTTGYVDAVEHAHTFHTKANPSSLVRILRPKAVIPIPPSTNGSVSKAEKKIHIAATLSSCGFNPDKGTVGKLWNLCTDTKGLHVLAKNVSLAKLELMAFMDFPPKTEYEEDEDKEPYYSTHYSTCSGHSKCKALEDSPADEDQARKCHATATASFGRTGHIVHHIKMAEAQSPIGLDQDWAKLVQS